MNKATTLGELKASGWQSRTVRQEMEHNLVRKLQAGERLFPGIFGFEDTVLPQLENAILAGHDFILLGEKGQAKSRILRSMVNFLDDEIPVIVGCEINDNPYSPICKRCRDLVAKMGDALPIGWWPRHLRYGERLAPGSRIGDLIGDLDPAKVAGGSVLSSEDALHFGLIPRMHRGLFAINELPDLEYLVQVALFNILEERDIQIRGYPIRFDLDVRLMFTANPEEYSRSGKIISQLKDRIGAEIRTHYPMTREGGIAIIDQEANLHNDGVPVLVPAFMKQIIEQITMEARKSPYVNQKSGVSARLSISNYETMVANSRRRALILNEGLAVPRISDLNYLYTSSFGKIELDPFREETVSEFQVVTRIFERAVKIVFDETVDEETQQALGRNVRGEVAVEVSDLMPSDSYKRIIPKLPALWDAVHLLGGDETPQMHAACIEFLLEGLYSSNKVSRSKLGDLVTYRSREQVKQEGCGMIIHRYSEYHEPEKPPFTVEDVIKAITDLMMRSSMGFQEALQHLMRQGLKFRSFLQINGLDELIDNLIAQLQALKAKDEQKYDVNKLLGSKQQDLQKMQDDLSRLLSKLNAGDATQTLQQVLRDKNLYQLHKLKWALTRRLGERQGQKVEDQLEKLTSAMEPLLGLSELARQNHFTGQEPISLPEAGRLKGRFDAIDKLIDELRQALESGDLESVNQQVLEKMLGQEAAKGFGDKRDEIMQQFEEAMEGTGMVERDEDGLFKLTPGAARKLGEYFLQSVFSLLRSDGVGKHSATLAGEGAVETVNARPMQYGDSVAHIDMSGTFMNALVREGPGLPIKVRHDDFMVFETRGAARSAIVMMLDMSGSMQRFGRFYNARKIAMALDALIRSQYADDKLFFVGFYTMARQYKIGDILTLNPKPVTYGGSSVRLKLDMSQPEQYKGKRIPEYFTNIQKGLELSRTLLDGEDTRNKSIIMISDGAPTAYYEGQFLNLCYPPDNKTFDVTLREVEKCTQAGIVINTFMMANDWDFGYHGEADFLSRMMKLNKGRVFYPKPESLTQYVMVDFLQAKRKLLQV